MLVGSESVVFLTYITDNNRNDGNEHFARRGIPTECFHTEFETEIVDCQIDRHNQDVATKLSEGLRVFGFGSLESDVFLEPETCYERDWKDDTQGSDVWSN